MFRALTSSAPRASPFKPSWASVFTPIKLAAWIRRCLSSSQPSGVLGSLNLKDINSTELMK